MPLVTVVTPCYNAEPFIGETIESVQSQTFQDWEHIVVDDGSTDRSLDVIQKHAKRDTSGRLRVLHQENSGVCRARNVGFAARSPDSRYVLFLDADDCPKREMLAKMTDHLETHSHVGLAYCLIEYIDTEGRSIGRPALPIRYDSSTWALQAVEQSRYESPLLAIFSGHAIPSTSLLRVSVLQRTDGFDETLGQPCEDVDLFSELTLLSSAHRISECLLKYRRYTNQVSQTSRRTGHHKRQRRRLSEKWSRRWPSDGDARFAQRRAVWRAWNGQVVPKIWMDAGRSLFKDGAVVKSATFACGSVLRYMYYTVFGSFLR